MKAFDHRDAVGSKTTITGWRSRSPVGVSPHPISVVTDEKGYKFSWSDLRDPVIEAVTGAGWTYKPKKM